MIKRNVGFLTRYKTISDVLEDGPVLLCGLTLDASVDITVKQYVMRDEDGQIKPKGSIEVTSSTRKEVSSLSLTVHTLDDAIELDLESFKIRHSRVFTEFLIECDKRAISKASALKDTEWEYLESED